MKQAFSTDGAAWKSLLGTNPIEEATKLVGAKSHSTGFDFVDFFSGCGGMSYGWHAIGHATGTVKPVGAFDANVHANRTYEQNLGLKPNDRDLALATIEQIRADLAANGRDESKPLITIGCAPCQGFSSHRKKDKRIDVRNGLVERFAEIAIGLDSDLIVMENVPDLLASKHRHHFTAFHDLLSAAGYKVAATVVNMAEHGVAQERIRAVVVAAKEFEPSLPAPAFSSDRYRTVRDLIAHLAPLEAGGADPSDLMHVTSKHRRETVEIMRQVPRDGGSRPAGVGPKCLDRVAGFSDVYGRLRWNRPAVTITARCRTPSCGRFTHPNQDRGLSVREAALLMGFPPGFMFEGPFDDKFKQCGNAVPPLFSLRLAGHLLAQMIACETIGADMPTMSWSAAQIERVGHEAEEALT